MRGKVADWWLPDEVVFVTEIPHNSDRQNPQNACESNIAMSSCQRPRALSSTAPIKWGLDPTPHNAIIPCDMLRISHW